MFDEKVVVRFKDGTTLRGFGDNFMPGDADILVQDLDDHLHTVMLRDVKLVCFVKEFTSEDHNGHERLARLIYQPVPGRTVEITFRDGEKLQGVTTLSTKPTGGFFVTPLNPHSNNVHIFVNSDEILSFRFLN